jgi:D-glycero-alpha-D-manno-heptose-7-phosphate kinase
MSSTSDIPSRTGLGGSSSYCVALSYLIKKIKEENIDSKEIINSAIEIEREILKESGGIQDQIWPFAKGFSSIEIKKDGTYNIKPLPITEEFEQTLQDSMILIYTEEQRNNDVIAKSHEDDINNKYQILETAKKAYKLFEQEDLKGIGELVYESWLSKERISPYISNNKIKTIIDDIINMAIPSGMEMDNFYAKIIQHMSYNHNHNGKYNIFGLTPFNTIVQNKDFESNIS